MNRQTTVLCDSLADGKVDTEVKTNNRPKERQQLIVGHIKKHLPLVEWVEVKRGLSPSRLKRSHQVSYIEFLKGAHDSAVSSGDTDWLQHGDLRVAHFGFPHMTAQDRLEKVPLYKQIGYFCDDTMTPISEHTYRLAAVSAQTAYQAATLLHANPTRLHYALTSSPGHHAGFRADRSMMGGYCYFNNAAIAALRLVQLGFAAVAVLDVDYHHGNGTQELLYDVAGVLTISLHMDPKLDYPSFTGFADEVGAGDGSGWNLNLPLSKGTDWKTYEPALQTALDRIRALKIQALVVAFGGDTLDKDPDASSVGGMCLAIEDYAAMGRMIAGLGLPTMITQEGGYTLSGEKHMGDVLVQFLGKPT